MNNRPFGVEKSNTQLDFFLLFLQARLFAPLVWAIFCFDRRAVLVALILKLLAKCMDEVELSKVN